MPAIQCLHPGCSSGVSASTRSQFCQVHRKRECEDCGRPFTPHDPTTKHCTDCRVKRARKAARA
jgi:hypothetical protein